ncbi:MAG TPA: hypothetical protein VNH15_03780 [Elusimicrobiota bacterium]|nr:hypothetical protein [Elusimicrobiota bacterium]
MKKTMATAAGLLCALALSAAAVSTKPMAKTKTAKAKTAAVKTHKTTGTTIWGDVQNVDAKTNALTLTEKSGKTVTVTLAATTKYTRGGRNAAVTASALKTGERVRVVAQNGSAQNIHVFVTWVASAKPAAAKKAKAVSAPATPATKKS